MILQIIIACPVFEQFGARGDALATRRVVVRSIASKKRLVAYLEAREQKGLC
jgi:hypothetical protein